MLRGYRCIVLAAVGWLILVASTPSAKTSPEKDTADQDIAAAGKPTDLAVNRSIQPDEHDKPCAKGEQNRNSDLCAQWEAADAAVDSATWAEKTYKLGIIGTVLGAITMAAAIAAAFYARSAALHAGGAHKAFISAERAILRIVSAGVANARGGELDRQLVAFTIKNIGRTSGRITAVGSKTTGSAPRWTDIPADEEGIVGGCELPTNRNAVFDDWFWIEYAIVGGGTGMSNFRVIGNWADSGLSTPGWRFEVFATDGHPDDI